MPSASARLLRPGVMACLAVALAACGTTAPVGHSSGFRSTPAGVSSAQAAPAVPSRTSVAPAASQASPRFIVKPSPLRLPVPTSRSVALPSGSSILLAGGLTSAGTTGAVIRIPVTGAHPTTVGRLSHPVHDAAGAALNGSLLVFGGGATTQDAWVQRVPLNGGASSVPGHLPAARADLGAVTVGSEVIVVSGGAGGRPDPRVLATSDGVHFRLVARLLVAVRYAAVAAVGGDSVVVIGGTSAAGDVATIQAVDVRTGATKVVGRLPRAISHATALAIGGSIVVAGGRHAGRALDTVIAVDPATFAVRTVGRLPRALSDAAGVVVDGVGYLVGGEAARALSTIETIAAV